MRYEYLRSQNRDNEYFLRVLKLRWDFMKKFQLYLSFSKILTESLFYVISMLCIRDTGVKKIKTVPGLKKPAYLCLRKHLRLGIIKTSMLQF